MTAANQHAHIVMVSSLSVGVLRSVIGAAAIGKPIEVTDLPGCRQIASNGVFGFLVPLKSPQAHSEALAMLLRIPALRRTMAAQRRSTAVELFSDQETNRQMRGEYFNLVEVASAQA